MHKSDIAFGVALAFISGIFIISAGWNLYILTACALVGVFLFFPRKIAVAFLCTFLIGALYYHFYVTHQSAQTRLPYDVSTTFSTIISDEPERSTQWWIFSVSPIPRGPTIEVFARATRVFAYGDEIQMTGKIKQSDVLGGNPIVFPEEISVVAEHQGFWLREWLIDVKSAILAKYNEFLPQDPAQLLGGITLGASNEINPDLKNALAVSGTSYIMAMYGYKIGVLAFTITEMLAGFFSRRVVFGITVSAIILFVMMAGADASAVRAGIMACIALVATLSGRTFNIRNAIAFTALAMLLFDPTLLVYNAGFELSFVSLLGIVYLGPSLKRLLGYQERGILHWKENVVVAIAAIIAIIPLTMLIFGSFSLTAVFSNILIGIAIPITMMFGIALAITGFISYYAAALIGRIASVVLGYELAVIHIFSVWVIPLPTVFDSTFAVIVYYLALIAFIFLYEGKASL